MIPRRLDLVLVLLAALPGAAAAQKGDLFSSDKPLQLRISTDLKALMSERDSNKMAPHAGTITYTAENGSTVSVDAQLSLRGHWRRQKANCDFAPIKVEFAKGKRDGTVFEGNGDL